MNPCEYCESNPTTCNKDPKQCEQDMLAENVKAYKDKDHPACVAASHVTRKYLDNVEKHNEVKLHMIGKFDLEKFCDFVELIESDTSGEIEPLCMPAPNKSGAALLVACYEDDYVALAGLRDKPRIFVD